MQDLQDAAVLHLADDCVRGMPTIFPTLNDDAAVPLQNRGRSYHSAGPDPP